MREWQRLRLARLCGRCGRLCAVGDPVLIIAAARWRKVRCATCAGEPPPELPALCERVEESRPMVPIRRLAGLSLDWKRAAAQREPGEEG